MMRDHFWMILSVESSKPDLDTVFVKTEEQVAEKHESGKRYDRHLLEWVNGSPSTKRWYQKITRSAGVWRHSDTADLTCPRANPTFVVMDLATHNSFVG